MKQVFKYGNIYERGEILDASKLSEILPLTDGQKIEADMVKVIFKEGKLKVEEFLKESVDFSFIIYPDGNAIMDVFISDEHDRPEPPQYSENIKIPKELKELWDEYMAQKKEAIMQRKSSGSTSDQGHFISSDPYVQEIENKFLGIVPKYVDLLKKVVQQSNQSKIRGLSAYLLQWQPDKQLAANLCIELLENDPNHGVHNDATRALNALLHKAEIPKEKIDVIFDIIYHPATACINKGIWLISDLFERNIISYSIIEPHLSRIRDLSQVKQPNISEFAKLTLEKIEKGLSNDTTTPSS